MGTLTRTLNQNLVIKLKNLSYLIFSTTTPKWHIYAKLRKILEIYNFSLLYLPHRVLVMGTTHWHDEDYFGSLVCGEEEAFSALEFLIDDLHVSKELTVHRFLGDAGSEDFIWSLVKFLGSRDSRSDSVKLFVIFNL